MPHGLEKVARLFLSAKHSIILFWNFDIANFHIRRNRSIEIGELSINIAQLILFIVYIYCFYIK